MIAYVDCISSQSARKCRNRTYYEDEDELLPLTSHTTNNLQNKNGGSLRRRLLTSKIHQQQERLWHSIHWDETAALKSSEPFSNQRRSTFKPMLENFTAVSSLDEESKWSVHYTAPWHQQENVFLPGSRPPCVEELHCQAKVNLKTVLRECDKLRKDGFRSSQYYSQGPTFSSPLLSHGKRDQDEVQKKKKPSAEEEELVYSSRPQTPQLDNVSDINNHNSWSKCLPLPTPEEKMRQQAQSVTTDIVPINITGENFDRQASFRRSVINTDTIIRRSKKVKRRKTITGVPDDIKKEFANNEPTGITNQSLHTTAQFSTLGHEESINSSLKHLVIRDSGCQTDNEKIVPPSMRRIRSQRGHGIATQITNIPLSSSGSILNTSDCNGAICSHQHNANDQGFHSLPRQGARICLQNCSNTPHLISGSTSSLPYQFTTQHANPDLQQISILRKTSSVTSRSDELHGFKNECHNATSGNMIYNHSSSTSSLNAASVLQNARNLSSVHSSQSFDTEDTPLHPMSTCSSSSGTPYSASSSCCQSPVSLHIVKETEYQCSSLDGRNCSPSAVCEDSDMSECSIHSCSKLTTDQWMYEPAPVNQCTSRSSSPISNVCNSLEHSPKKTDVSSLSSADIEGCFTFVNLAQDCKSYSLSCINKVSSTRHNLYEWTEHHSHDDRASLHSNQSLTRSISLRKAKKPPLPPKRTDSLQRKPRQKPYHNEKPLNEQLISSLHESLKTHSASFSGQMPFCRLEDPWVLGSRSLSSVSIASSGMSAPAAVCPTTPTIHNSISQHSEYTKSWDFHIGFPHSCSEHELTSQIMRPVLAKENTRCLSSNGTSLTTCNKTGINSKMTSSSDMVQLMTSPSSGYSSQSITPTAGTPVTSLLRAKSSAERPKPKVPERKSSLRGSVSSYSMPLSSKTLDSVRSLSPPPLPKTLPGLVTLQSSSSNLMPSFILSPITPVPPLAASSISDKKQSSSPVSSTTPGDCKTSRSFSSGSPPPTSDVSSPLMLIKDKKSTLPLPSPPPLPLSSSDQPQPPTPPLPGTCLQAVTILKATNIPKILDTVKNGKELNFRQSDKPARQERPVISAQALQKVQLRPIKLMKLENIFTDIITTVCSPENLEHKKVGSQSTDKPVETEMVKNIVTSDSVSPRAMNSTDFPSKESTTPMFVSNSASDFLEPFNDTLSSKNILNLSSTTPGPQSTPPVCFNLLQSTATLSKSNGILQDQWSPVSPKMSNHTLIFPPILYQPALNNLEHLDVTGSAVSSETEALNCTSLTDTVNQNEIPLQLEFEVESDSQASTPMSARRHSLSSEISSDSLTDPQFTGLSLSDQETGLCDTDLCDGDYVLSDDKGITEDSLSSSSGSITFKEEENDENDAVFDSGTDSSSPTFSSTEEDIEELMTPTRPRTTDDLFAVIHRSKRKVLGRCESEEERSSSFITPTSSSLSITWTPRQSSHIQRRSRHSATSNDSFKALLLKKGSRSEPGFRMSAMEMLKSTDPRLQRSNAEAPSPFSSLCTSPGNSRRVSEEWARTEGALPRLSPLLSHSKYGRSSTPPCAASSRYNSRSRVPSGPMTVICEREGEQMESIDCSNMPFPVSKSSSGTVCAQGST